MTRTALKMNGLSELHIRSARKGAKAPFKTKEQNQVLIYQLNFKKNSTFFQKYDRI